jgi:GT2 family glycosyltransferase
VANIDISFVVPLFNHLEETKAMLASLQETIPQSYQYEIILVDDCSSDKTPTWMKQIDSPLIKTYINPSNQGYANTNNIGVSHAQGTYLVLINNDLLFTQGWLEPMLAAIQDPVLNAGIVGNIQYRVIDKMIDHVGVEVTEIGQIDHIRTIDNQRDLRKVFATTGACMLMKRADFVALRGFDEAYVNGVEDVDLCLRMKQLGKSIYVAQQSHIYHHVSLSRDRASIRNEMNSQLFYKKWRSEIKSELSRKWAQLLSQTSQPVEFSSIDGALAPSFLASPQIASRVLAEHFISREEARWVSLIDHIDQNKELERKCSIKGMRYSESHRCYLVAPVFEFHVRDVDSAINFFVCGRRVDPQLKENIAIIIDINGIQTKRINLSDDFNINVGVLSPILIKSITNIFKISVKFFDSQTNELLGDANQSVVIGHFVLNDMELHHLR